MLIGQRRHKLNHRRLAHLFHTKVRRASQVRLAGGVGSASHSARPNTVRTVRTEHPRPGFGRSPAVRSEHLGAECPLHAQCHTERATEHLLPNLEQSEEVKQRRSIRGQAEAIGRNQCPAVPITAPHLPETLNEAS